MHHNKTIDNKTIALRLIVALLILVVSVTPTQAKKKKKKRTPKPTPVAGVFDYYVVSMSWSPQYCGEPAGKHDTMQCHSQRKFAFVLHGLWPQFESGYPQSCSNVKVEDAVRDSMLDIMPSTKLVRHEWEKHGTCSGMEPEAYFDAARNAFTSVNIPPAFDSPPKAFKTSVSEIETAFNSVNPDLNGARIAVRCKGNLLQELRICMTKDLQARDCGRDVKDGCKSKITVQPVK